MRTTGHPAASQHQHLVPLRGVCSITIVVPTDIWSFGALGGVVGAFLPSVAVPRHCTLHSCVALFGVAWLPTVHQHQRLLLV